MPLYDFHCRGCGHEFEALVRAGEEQPACPSCKGRDIERLISSFGFSYAERTAAFAKESRKRHAAGRKDALIADEEYRQKHDKE